MCAHPLDLDITLREKYSATSLPVNPVAPHITISYSGRAAAIGSVCVGLCLRVLRGPGFWHARCSAPIGSTLSTGNIATFIATFVYAVLVLRVVRDAYETAGDPGFVPQLSLLTINCRNNDWRTAQLSSWETHRKWWMGVIAKHLS